MRSRFDPTMQRRHKWRNLVHSTLLLVGIAILLGLSAAAPRTRAARRVSGAVFQWSARGVLVLACALAVGCGGDHECIEGSATDSYDMSYDSIRARRFSTEVSIEFVRSPGEGEEIPLKLSVSFEENDIEVGTPLDLHPPSGNVDRVTTNPARLPELCDPEEGPSELTFSKYSETDGGSIEGENKICFGVGTNLTGCFDAALDVIE